MARTQSFDRNEILDRAAEVFLRLGYEGASIDDLVKATGLHRGSLYNAFSSKLGIFQAVLGRTLDTVVPTTPTDRQLDLALVALLELAPRDVTVRDTVVTWIATVPGSASEVLGARLLRRAGIDSERNPT